MIPGDGGREKGEGQSKWCVCSRAGTEAGRVDLEEQGEWRRSSVALPTSLAGA